MYMSIRLISLLTTIAAARSISPRQQSNTYAAVSFTDAFPAIDGQDINANGNRFYINKDSSAYCPEGISGLDCSKFGDATVIAYGSEYKTLGLATSVAGGQSAYVDKDGALGYTVPHSGAMPADSVTRGFELKPSTSGANLLMFNGAGFTACPTNQQGVYQVYAVASPVASRTDCQQFSFSLHDSPAVAYQY